MTWIVCRDYHTEGLKEPFYAFETEGAAKAFVEASSKLLEGSLKIVKADLGPGERPKPPPPQLTFRGAPGGEIRGDAFPLRGTSLT